MQNKKRTESSKDAYQTAGSEERKKASDRREEKTLERREEKRREEDGRHYERSKQEKQKTEKRDWGLTRQRSNGWMEGGAKKKMRGSAEQAAKKGRRR